MICDLINTHVYIREPSNPSDLNCEETKKGKRIFVNTEVKAGQICLSNIASSHLLLTSYWGTRCCYCLHSKHSKSQVSGEAEFQLSRCAKCRQASYCSRYCQTKDWQQHKGECSKLAKIWDSPMVDETLIILRYFSSLTGKDLGGVCQRLPLTAATNTVFQSGGYCYTKCGKNHLQSLHAAQKAVIEAEEQEFLLQLEGLTGKTTAALAHLLAQFHSNNFGIMDELMSCIGIGVYPSIALLNHSCDPNCILRYRLSNIGPIAEVVAIRNVSPGEELTHSYTELTNIQSMRQTELFKNYGFHCDCCLCSTEPTSIGAVDQFIDDPLALREFLKSIKYSDNVSKAMSMDGYLTAINDATKAPGQELLSHISLLYQTVMSGQLEGTPQEAKVIEKLLSIESQLYCAYYKPFHRELYRYRCQLLTLLVITGDEANAYRTCCRIVSYLALAFINMPIHPLLGIQLFTLGDLAQETHPELARQYYSWSYEILSICYDEHTGELHNKLKEILEC